jgi:hypothetical protein
VFRDGTEKALTANAMTESWDVRAPLVNTRCSEGAISCDPGGRTGSSKNRKAGAISSKEKSPLSFFANWF